MMKSRKVMLVAVLALAIVGVLSAAAMAGNGKNLAVDVAEDPSRYVFTGTSLIEDGPLAGFPDNGDFFVTQGFIYPAGTLDADDPGVDCEVDEEGVATSCEPLYEPIGEWTCYGVHVGEGAATTEGAWVATTQIFELYDDHGSQTIITEGFESPEVGETVRRAVTGGTGRYSTARGEQHQLFLGIHPDFFNVRTSNVLAVSR